MAPPHDLNDFAPLDGSSVVAVSPDQVSAELGMETAILALADGRYYGLSDVGALIWRVLQSPVAVSVIVDAVVSEYDVPREEAEKDLLALLRELMDKKLVRLMI